MRDVGAGGEVVDLEGAAHVVDGEEGENGALHVGHRNGDDGEILLALDGDPLGGGVGPQPHLRLRPVIRGDAHGVVGNEGRAFASFGQIIFRK